MKDKVFLLYTGGWDSTFRLCQLCRSNVQIQPVYIIDRGRPSFEIEMEVMQRIFREVRKLPGFVADLLPLKNYERTWVEKECANHEISEAWNKMREDYRIGTQYEWFALLLDKLGIEMETAVVHQYHGWVEEAIRGEGSLELIHNDFLPNRYKVKSKDNENNNLEKVFGKLIFPVLDLTKEDEKRIASKESFFHIMKMTWFCYRPRNGKPCGICGPCNDAFHTGMGWRLPITAHIRHYLFVATNAIRDKAYEIKQRIVG